jgi:ribosomal protein L11 methylase PrmA
VASSRRASLARVLAIGLAVLVLAACGTGATTETARPRLDVVWVRTEIDIVRAMLDAAAVGPNDLVYDLGCGDGIIPITAARLYGARGYGVDIDPQRIRDARANAARAGVSDRVTFAVGDLFETDVKPATVVALYLLPDLNLRLRPKLQRDLRAGSRIVSHDFDMGDWLPERTIEVPQPERTHKVFLWRVPDRR